MLQERQFGVMIINGPQHPQPLAVVPITQAGRWRSVSWGSSLQMAFNTFNHLQPYRLPKLDDRERQLGLTTTNGLQVLNHFQPCWLSKLHARGV